MCIHVNTHQDVLSWEVFVLSPLYYGMSFIGGSTVLSLVRYCTWAWFSCVRFTSIGNVVVIAQDKASVNRSN